MKIVEVVWEDAHCSTDGVTTKESENVKPVLTRTVGYLVTDNKHGLLLASDAYDDSPGEFRVMNFIPHGMIVSYDHLVE